MSSVTPQRSVEDKDGTPPPKKKGVEGVRGEGGGKQRDFNLHVRVN